MNNETKLRLASAGIDITEIIPADSIVVPKTLWNEWAEKIEQMGNQQHATEAEPIQPGTPKMGQGEQPWKAIESDSVGIIRHDGTVRAWCIRENAGVEVFAKQHFVEGKPAACWSFTGTVDCEKVIVGSIFGGRNKANQIVRHIRNGLLAARLRLRHKRLNRQAKSASVPAVPPTTTEAQP